MVITFPVTAGTIYYRLSGLKEQKLSSLSVLWTLGNLIEIVGWATPPLKALERASWPLALLDIPWLVGTSPTSIHHPWSSLLSPLIDDSSHWIRATPIQHDLTFTS